MPTFQCPTCRSVFSVERLDQASYRPFCSERCQLVDLYHWFRGDYRISDPIPEEPPEGQAGGENDAAGEA